MCDTHAGAPEPEVLVSAYRAALANLSVLHFELVLRPERPLDAPMPAALLRGVLGNRLRLNGCIRVEEAQPPCPPDSGCMYCLLFEGRPPRSGNAWSHRLEKPPHPFALRVTPEGWLQHKAELFLYGQATEGWRQVLASLQQSAHAGIGVGGVRAGFEARCLDAAGVETGVLVDGALRGAIRPWPALQRAQAALREILGAPAIRIRTTSPLRIKSGGEYVREADLRLLVVNACRRIAALVAEYGDGSDMPTPPKSWLDQLQAIPAVQSSWGRVTQRRYSFRQCRDVEMSGIIGGCTYGCIQPAALEILAAATVLGLGKGLSFGMGWIAVESVDVD